MKFYSVNDKEFQKYGKVLDIDTTEIIKVAQAIEYPESGSKYVPSEPQFETLEVSKLINKEIFGEIPSQMGYCWGYNDTLNALEWHKCSEVNIAVTDLVLLLGDVRELEDDCKYNSENVKAFLVKKGEAIEVFATTLHFCPIMAKNDGFGCVVGLLKDTNTNLETPSKDKRLFRKNKWIIAHNDNAALIEKGVVAGIYNENYKICEEDIK